MPTSPGLYPNVPLPGQVGTPFVWDNTATPIVITQAPTVPGGVVFRLSDYVSGAFDFPAAGTFAIIDRAWVTVENGPSHGGASLYARPQFAAGMGRGDGPYVVPVMGLSAGETATHSGRPGLPAGWDAATLTELWNAPYLWTPSIEVAILTAAEPGAKIVFHVEGTLYSMEQGQQEIVFNTLLVPVKPPAPTYEVLGQVPSGFAWVPVAAEVNPSAGADAGPRQAALLFGTSANLPPGTVLAESPVEDTPNVGNNNTTGSYVANGSGPGDGVGKSHTLWPPGLFVPAGDTVQRYWAYQADDELHYCVVFLQTPAVALKVSPALTPSTGATP